MINYFNSKRLEDGYLLTNDFGEYIFLDFESYDQLIHGMITPGHKNYQSLAARGFIIEGSAENFLQENIWKLRSMKSYCMNGTALHIFAVTNMCNLDCIYCQAHSKSSYLDGRMTIETGRRAIEIAMGSASPNLTFEFQGGEPLMNFEVIKGMIDYSKELNRDGHKNIEYTLVSNLILLNDEILQYLVDNKVSICTSLDGPEEVHNFNRPFRSRTGGSYQKVIEKIKYLKSKGIKVNAIQTTTGKSIHYPEEIVKQYLDLGIHGVFLRQLTPLGMAESDWEKVGYTSEEFLEFYKKAFWYIMDLNKKGIFFMETHAAYFLKKILCGYSDNYMELRSPCGAALGQMSYYYNGNIYTCDEGRMMSEMGDDSFLLGNVYDHTYSDLIASPICKTLCKASIVEALPKCNDCVYQPYCGTCPVVNYASNSDLYAKNPKDFRCQVYKGIQDLLFEIIKRNDEQEMAVLYSWIN